MDLKNYLRDKRRSIDKTLDETLPKEDNEPVILHKAMRYSLFAGGKRIRPILAMAAAEAVGRDGEDVLPLAVALECIHTYSLIHDDLPAMDDDDMRRGKPTSHKVFGDAIAVLAGDALLAFAFEVLGSPGSLRCYRSERLLAVIGELSTAAGSEKLVAGQAMDILCEGRTPDPEMVAYIIRNKTGALIRASLTCGGLLAGGTREQVETLGRFGRDLGALFQIKDDLLDLEGDPATLGKAVNKDQERGKATYPSLLGIQESKNMVRKLTTSARGTIRRLGKTAEPLEMIAKYVGERVN